jgi:hypothetical protein
MWPQTSLAQCSSQESFQTLNRSCENRVQRIKNAQSRKELFASELKSHNTPEDT